MSRADTLPLSEELLMTALWADFKGGGAFFPLPDVRVTRIDGVRQFAMDTHYADGLSGAVLV